MVIASEIIPTGVVGHEQDDVGLLVLDLQGPVARMMATVAVSTERPQLTAFGLFFISFGGYWRQKAKNS